MNQTIIEGVDDADYEFSFELSKNLKFLSQFQQYTGEMGLIEMIAVILGLYSVLPRIGSFFEVLNISFGPIQKDLLRRYYDFNGESFAVVIGGTSGIGRELALKLARCGFSIFLIGKNKCKLEEVKKMIQSET